MRSIDLGKYTTLNRSPLGLRCKSFEEGMKDAACWKCMILDQGTGRYAVMNFPLRESIYIERPAYLGGRVPSVCNIVSGFREPTLSVLHLSPYYRGHLSSGRGKVLIAHIDEVYLLLDYVAVKKLGVRF